MTEIIAHVQMPTNWVDILFTAASILISVVAVFISVQTFRSQKEQNKNSVRPILNVSVGDYEDNIGNCLFCTNPLRIDIALAGNSASITFWQRQSSSFNERVPGSHDPFTYWRDHLCGLLWALLRCKKTKIMALN